MHRLLPGLFPSQKYDFLRLVTRSRYEAYFPKASMCPPKDSKGRDNLIALGQESNSNPTSEFVLFRHEVNTIVRSIQKSLFRCGFTKAKPPPPLSLVSRVRISPGEHLFSRRLLGTFHVGVRGMGAPPWMALHYLREWHHYLTSAWMFQLSPPPWRHYLVPLPWGMVQLLVYFSWQQ